MLSPTNLHLFTVGASWGLGLNPLTRWLLDDPRIRFVNISSCGTSSGVWGVLVVDSPLGMGSHSH